MGLNVTSFKYSFVIKSLLLIFIFIINSIVVFGVETPNPELESSCGLDMVLIIDSSGSIDYSELKIMKNAFKGFVDAFLPNTPTEIAVVDFDTKARLLQAYTDNIDDINSAIDSTSTGGNTNWENALQVAHSKFNNRLDKPDLYVFASDGNPNRCGDPPTSCSAVAEAVEKANQIKLDGVRIITLGIGDKLKRDNLIAISSADAYYSSDFDTLAQTLASIAEELCGGTITVKKLIDGQEAEEAKNWEFTADVTGGTPDPSSGSTDSTGFITFEIDITNSNAEVDIIETVKTGYILDSATCWKGQTEVGSPGIDSVDNIVIGKNDIIYCEFNNRIKTFCGDEQIQSPNDDYEYEECDDGAQNGAGCSPPYGSSCQYCDYDCTITTLNGDYCGDEIINGPEECEFDADCDDFDEHTIDTCLFDCTCENEYVPYCGDGNIDLGEECDDGNNVDGDGCDAYCIDEYCGDNIVNDVDEQCDDGNNLDGDGCNANCIDEYCGDGITNDVDEQCDDANQNNDDECANDCTLTYCGDNIVQDPNGYLESEQCDDGGNANNDGCNANCIIEFCGDNILQTGIGEECDDGNNVDGDGCNANCIDEFCGDNIVNDVDEECDDGNTVSGDGCDANCNDEYCGDGVLQPSLGEECEYDADCDDYDEHTIDTCTDCLCDNEYIPYCGDGNIDPGEECESTGSYAGWGPYGYEFTCKNDNTYYECVNCHYDHVNECKYYCSGDLECDGLAPNTELEDCSYGYDYLQDYCDENCLLADDNCEDDYSGCTADPKCDEENPFAPVNPYCTYQCSVVDCLIDADCDDGLFCNGQETCNQYTHTCETGTPIVCDDGLFCNGVETCNEAIDSCVSGTPVVCEEDEYCDEDTDRCEPIGCKKESDRRNIIHINFIAFDKDFVRPGDLLNVYVNFENLDCCDLKDARLTAIIRELGIRSNTIKSSTVKENEQSSKRLTLEIPEYAQPGRYWVQIVIDIDGDRRIKYRPVDVIY